jgi:signal transduction histidine kinase
MASDTVASYCSTCWCSLENGNRLSDPSQQPTVALMSTSRVGTGSLSSPVGRPLWSIAYGRNEACSASSGERAEVVSEQELSTCREQVLTLTIQREHLLEDLVLAEERERARIAGEIHDDPVQVLDAVSLRLDNAAGDSSEDAARRTLLLAGASVREATSHLRMLMIDLMPAANDDDLRGSLESYCASLFAAGQTRCGISGDPGELTPSRARLAYRLVQEALRNAAKHARATRVTVSFEGDERIVRICIGDDGVGIAADAEHDSPLHGGLRLLRRRVEAAGGTIGVGPGLDARGCEVAIELPRKGYA